MILRKRKQWKYESGYDLMRMKIRQTYGRDVVTNFANDGWVGVSLQLSVEVQPWALPDNHIFAAASLVWPATPLWRNIGDMCEADACLPAVRLISATGWGAKVSSGLWEGKWSSHRKQKRLHPDKWGKSPVRVAYIVWYYPSLAFSASNNTEHQWQHIE